MTDTMKGVPLGTFGDALRPLPAKVFTDPYDKGDLRAMLPADTIATLEARRGRTLTSEDIRKLRRENFEGIRFEDICRIRTSSMFSMSSSMEEMFEQDPRYTMFERIRTSKWHWGTHRPNWNEYVAAYEGLRRFSLGIPDFEARITWTNSARDGGDSDHCDTWLDGHFAYLVHYRGEHVMTLGFSFSGTDRLLLQQVQTASPRGNRWLFRLPRNRMEFVIDRFAAAFPDHAILVVDGVDLAQRNIQGLARPLRRAQERVERLSSPAGGKVDDQAVERALTQVAEIEAHIAGIERDTARLTALYADCGRYQRLPPQTINRMQHYPLAA